MTLAQTVHCLTAFSPAHLPAAGPAPVPGVLACLPAAQPGVGCAAAGSCCGLAAPLLAAQLPQAEPHHLALQPFPGGGLAAARLLVRKWPCTHATSLPAAYGPGTWGKLGWCPARGTVAATAGLHRQPTHTVRALFSHGTRVCLKGRQANLTMHHKAGAFQLLLAMFHVSLSCQHNSTLSSCQQQTC